MIKLKTLEIKALRGIRDWEIPLNGRSLVVWGENASGKSSVVDALEFFFTGAIGHLVGTMGLSVARHAPHVDLGSDKLQVAVTFDPGAITLSRSLASQPAAPPALQSLWADACSGAFILRRSQLLEFIHADPADRFRAIASMIGAEPLDHMELAMMRARDRFDGERTAEKSERDRIQGRLKELVGDGPSIDSLNQDVSALRLSPVSSLDAVPSKVEEWLRSAKQSDQERVASLQELKTCVEQASVPAGTAKQLLQYGEAHSNLLSQRENLARLSEVELLAQGERLIEASGLPRCPLCEQAIDPQDTLTRIRARREVLQALSEEASKVRQQQAALLTSVRSLEQRVSAAQGVLGPIPEKDRPAVQKALDRFRIACSGAARALESSADFHSQCNVRPFVAAIPHYEGVRSRLLKSAEEQQQALALTERDQRILALARKANDVARLSSELDAQTKKLKRAEELHRRAQYVFDTLVVCKKAEIRRIYDAIQADVCMFYDILHPGEPHKDFELVLAGGRRASTQLRINAFGQGGEDPRAFTSEGHLDSLGLCIFLAFVRNFRSACPLVVLDDAVMSIDAGHRGRVAELLLTEFQNWQLIITTHDEIWLDELQRHQRAYQAEGRFLNLRIQRWSLADGPVVSPYEPRWERIESKLAAADKTGAANDGRQFLEWILMEICTSTDARGAPIRKDGRYTVSDLQEPVQRRLLQLLPGMRSDIDHLFQEITAAGAPGNLLSHENADAHSISVLEVRRFCEAVKALADWYQCDCCGETPVYSRDAREICCPNRRCKSPKKWPTG
jgi:recombinational DNA repair ATPase RecF